MVKNLVSLAVMLLATSAPQLFAQSCENIDPIYDTDGSSCMNLDFSRADIELNKQYRGMLNDIDQSSLTKDQKSLLRDHLISAQRAWLKTTEHDCAAVFEFYADGTMRVAAELQCRLNRTKARTSELKKLFDPFSS